MSLRSVGLGVLATATAAVAAENHLASIEVIKYIGTVCGALYAAGKLLHVVTTWATHSVKEAVREEINKKFGTLPCVKAADCPEGD